MLGRASRSLPSHGYNCHRSSPTYGIADIMQKLYRSEQLDKKYSIDELKTLEIQRPNRDCTFIGRRKV